jgi:hypothetical protein
MKRTLKNPIFILVMVFVLAFGISCGGGGSSISTGGITTAHNGLDGAVGYIPSTTLPSDAENVSNYNISLSNLNGHSVYAVASNQLVNHSRTNRVKFYGGTEANSISRIVTSNAEEKFNSKMIVNYIPKFNPSMEETIENISKNMVSTLNKSVSKSSYTVGITNKNFNVDTSSLPITTTLRARQAMDGQYLNIWVDDEIWTTDAQTKLNSIMNDFLLKGDNSIYSKVTDIFGDSYYNDSKSYRITDSDINIVLFNINGNNPGNSRTLGYFDPVDVYRVSVNTPNSNEINGFYIDFYSLMDSDEFWSEAAYSSIAHEFLHSIVFYHKYLRYGKYPDTWLNEMLAMVTEDILSDELELMGPKGQKILMVVEVV